MTIKLSKQHSLKNKCSILEGLGTFVKNQVTTNVSFHFWTLSPLVYLSVLVPVPSYLEQYSFAVSLGEKKKRNRQTWDLLPCRFLKEYTDYLGSCLSMWILESTWHFLQRSSRNFIEITSNLETDMRNVVIVVIYLFWSMDAECFKTLNISFHFFSGPLWFSEYRSSTSVA